MKKFFSIVCLLMLTVVSAFAGTTYEPDVEYTSLGDLEGKTFAIVNKADGKALFGSNAQNLGYDVYATAFQATNSGYVWKAELDAESGAYYLQLVTPAGADYNCWGMGGVLNSQGEPQGWACSFILGGKGNAQKGQDIQNGALWKLEYTAEGWTLKNVGTDMYQGHNTKPANSTEAAYWTFCSLKEVDDGIVPETFEMPASLKPFIENGTQFYLKSGDQYLIGGDQQAVAMGSWADVEACTNSTMWVLTENEDGSGMFRAVTADGSNVSAWGANPCFLNAQPAVGGVLFKMNKDQDITNGSSWILAEVEGGYTLQCVANKGYATTAVNTAAEPVVWQLYVPEPAGWDGTITTSLDDVVLKSADDLNGLTITFNGAKSIEILNDIENDLVTDIIIGDTWNYGNSVYYLWTLMYNESGMNCKYTVEGDKLTLTGFINAKALMDMGQVAPLAKKAPRKVLVKEGDTEYQLNLYAYGIMVDGEEADVDLYFNCEAPAPEEMALSNLEVQDYISMGGPLMVNGRDAEGNSVTVAFNAEGELDLEFTGMDAADYSHSYTAKSGTGSIKTNEDGSKTIDVTVTMSNNVTYHITATIEAPAACPFELPEVTATAEGITLVFDVAAATEGKENPTLEGQVAVTKDGVEYRGGFSETDVVDGKVTVTLAPGSLFNYASFSELALEAGDEIEVALLEVSLYENFTAGGYDTTWEGAMEGSVKATVAGDEPVGPALEAGQYFVMENESGLFLSNGANWGTRSVLFGNGICYNVELGEDGKYTLKSGIKNANTALRPSDGFNDQSGAWELIPTDGGYYMFNGEKYFTRVEGDVRPQYTENKAEASVWSFVTEAERKAALAEATDENPVDATVYIKAPDFHNADVANAAWSGSPKVGGAYGNGDLLANNSNAEKWNAGEFTVDQTITDLPNGIYKVTCQGYTRKAGASVESADSYEAGEELPAYLFANGEKVALMSIFAEAAAEGYSNVTATSGTVYSIANGQNTAADMFTKGAYVNELTVEVTDGTLNLGVTSEGGIEWVVFDSFRLTYYGAAPEKIVTPAFIAGEEEITLNDHSLVSVEAAEGLKVNFENMPEVIGATYLINEMNMGEDEEGNLFWHVGKEIAAGEMGMNAIAYTQFDKTINFYEGKKYQLTVTAFANPADPTEVGTYTYEFNGATEVSMLATFVTKRGAWTVSAGTLAATNAINAEDANQQFALIEVEGATYLWNQGAQGFVNNSGKVGGFAEASPIEGVEQEDGTIFFHFTDAEGKYINHNNTTIVIDGWSQVDDGNKVTVTPVAPADMELVQDVIAYRSDIDKLLAMASEELEANSGMGKLITSASQLSSNATEPNEGSIEALLDGNTNTFWHSKWSAGNAAAHEHYLQVELAEPIEGTYLMSMSRRNAANDHVTLMSVEASLDGETYTEIAEYETPKTDAVVVEATFEVPTAAKYLRFFADATTNNRGYWHCSEFQLYPTEPDPNCPNALHPEETAALQEAIDAAGYNAASLEALSAAYAAYMAVVNPTLVVTPALINGEEEITLNDHSLVSVEKAEALKVQFEGAPNIIGATYLINEMIMGETEEGIFWHVGKELAAGEMSMNNIAYAELNPALVFEAGKKYQLTVTPFKNAEDPQEMPSVTFEFNGATEAPADEFEGTPFDISWAGMATPDDAIRTFNFDGQWQAIEPNIRDFDPAEDKKIVVKFAEPLTCGYNVPFKQADGTQQWNACGGDQTGWDIFEIDVTEVMTEFGIQNTQTTPNSFTITESYVVKNDESQVPLVWNPGGWGPKMTISGITSGEATIAQQWGGVNMVAPECFLQDGTKTLRIYTNNDMTELPFQWCLTDAAGNASYPAIGVDETGKYAEFTTDLLIKSLYLQHTSTEPHTIDIRAITWEFTPATPEPTAPEIVSVTVNPNAQIVAVTFDAEDAAPTNNVSFALETADGTAVNTTVSGEYGQNYGDMIYTFGAALEAGDYVLVLPAGSMTFSLDSTPFNAEIRIPFTVDSTVGINNVENTIARDGKFLQNGKIVIVKNGKTFSTTGARMK